MAISSSLAYSISSGIAYNPALSAGDRINLNIGIFGSSNVGGSARDDSTNFTDQIDSFESGTMQRLKHDGTLADFETPVNNDNGVTTYNLINEEMYYGPIESMITRLREFTGRTINVVSGYDSGIPVGYTLSGGTLGWFESRNSSDPFDTTKQYGQVITRFKQLMDETGETLDIIYLPDAGKDATFGAGTVPAQVVTSYKNGIDNMRADLGLSDDTVFILPNLGPLPSNSSIYPNWAAIIAEINGESSWPANVHVIDPNADLGADLEDHVQFEYTVSSRSGTWTIGETITGGTSSQSGKLNQFTNSADTIWIEAKPGTGFTDGETVTGSSSGATATITVSGTNPATVHYNTKMLNALGTKAAELANDNLSLSPDLFPYQLTSANLLLELDAEDANSYDLSGSDLIEWRSKSGRPFYFTVENDSPHYEASGYNSRPCFDFDGSDDAMECPEFDENVIGEEDGYHVLMLLEHDDIVDSGSSFNWVLALGSYITGTDRGKILINQPRNDMDQIGSYSNGSGSSGNQQVVGDATPYLLDEGCVSGVDGRVYFAIDGVAAFDHGGDTSDLNTAQSPFQLVIGGDKDTSSRKFSGKINKILIYDDRLSTDDLSSIATELMKRNA